MIIQLLFTPRQLLKQLLRKGVTIPVLTRKNQFFSSVRQGWLYRIRKWIIILNGNYSRGKLLICTNHRNCNWLQGAGDFRKQAGVAYVVIREPA